MKLMQSIVDSFSFALLIYFTLLALSFGFWGMFRLQGDAVLYYASIEAFHVDHFKNLSAVEYLDAVEPHRMMFKIIPWRWHPAIIYPPGMALASQPGLYLGDLVGKTLSHAGSIRFPHRIGRLFGILLWHLGLTFLTLLTLHQLLVSALNLNHRHALIAVVSVFLGTPWWFYATRQILYSHALELSALIFGLAGWWLGTRTPQASNRWWGLLSGIAWGLAVATRYAAVGWVLPVFLLGCYRAFKNRTVRWVLYTLVGSLPFAFFILWYHACFYRSPLQTGYASILFAWSYPLKDALRMILFRSWAVWFHPVRGFALWHPIIFLAGIGLLALPAQHRRWMITSTAGLWLLLIVYTDWWAGVSCGQRLLLDLAPALAFGVASLIQRRSPRTFLFLGLAVAWNLLLTLGFTAGAWQGYNDGRLGERYPFYHILNRIVREPTATLKALQQRTWNSPDHPRHWVGYKLIPARADDYLTPVSDGSAWWISGFDRVSQESQARLVITIDPMPRAPYPAGWLLTAVSDPVHRIPGLHRWRIRVGYPSPFIQILYDNTPIPIRFHTENLHRLLLPNSPRGVRVEVVLHDEPHRTMKIYRFRLPLPSPLAAPLSCHSTQFSYFVNHHTPWTAPSDGRLLVWAWPALEPPWFQGVRIVHPGETIPIPFRPLQIARQAYVGKIVFCFDKTNSSLK